MPKNNHMVTAFSYNISLKICAKKYIFKIMNILVMKMKLHKGLNVKKK